MGAELLASSSGQATHCPPSPSDALEGGPRYPPTSEQFADRRGFGAGSLVVTVTHRFLRRKVVTTSGDETVSFRGDEVEAASLGSAQCRPRVTGRTVGDTVALAHWGGGASDFTTTSTTPSFHLTSVSAPMADLPAQNPGDCPPAPLHPAGPEGGVSQPRTHNDWPPSAPKKHPRRSPLPGRLRC